MEYKKISDISTLRNENINSNKNKDLLYITTTHLLPEKEGISQEYESSLGKSGKLFYRNDILVSNIRPYFKKIWKAEKDGITSNDVLIFLSNDLVHQDYLYYLLSQDSFFNMMTLTAKGTKMPRGDKKAIALYEVPILDKKQQKIVCDILNNYDKKIETNNKIIANLEAQAQALFKYYFIDFEPFADGNFVDSDLGLIPEGWEVVNLEKIINVLDSKRIPLSKMERDGMEKNYPYYGANGIIDYVEDYLFDGTYLLMGEDGTVIDEYNHPILNYVNGKIWVNNHAHVLTGKDISTEYLYVLLSQTNIQKIVTGAVQLKINQTNLKSIRVVKPSEKIIDKYENFINSLFKEILILTKQNQTLAQARDALLPRLMAGEIDLEGLGGSYD